MRLPSFLLAPAFVGSVALAQVDTVLPFYRTSDVLVGDGVSGSILRLFDGDLDGSYGTFGEAVVWFDPTATANPATGLPYGALGTPAVLTGDRLGWTYAIYNGGATTVVRMRDLDGNGDAMGAGESSVYASSSTVPILAVGPCRGAAFDPSGALWLTIDGATNDLVVKLTDLNGDHDATDSGEATVVYDDSISASNGNPPLFDVSAAGFLPGGDFYLSNAAAFHKFTVRLVDMNGNGVYHDAGEVQLVYSSSSGNPSEDAAKWVRLGPDGRLYIFNSTTGTLIAAADTNKNLVYDDAGEALVFAATGDNGLALTPDGRFDLRDDGTLFFVDAQPGGKLLRFRDGSGDGDARDAGEGKIDLDFSTSFFPATKPVSIYFLPAFPASYGTGCPTSLGGPFTIAWKDGSGLSKIGNAEFALRASGGPAFATIGLMYSNAPSALPLSALVVGIADPSCILYVDLFAADVGTLAPGASTDGSGNAATIPLPIPKTLAPLAGLTYSVQAVVFDPGLSLPVVLSNGVSIPLL